MEEKIREIIRKIEFDVDSWSTGIIKAEEYNRRKDQFIVQLKALFVEIPESLKKKAIEELNKMTDPIYRGCQKYYIHALYDVRARIEGGAK